MSLEYTQTLRNTEGSETKVAFRIDYVESPEVPGGQFISRCPVPGCTECIGSMVSATYLIDPMRNHLIVKHDFQVIGNMQAGEFTISQGS